MLTVAGFVNWRRARTTVLLMAAICGLLAAGCAPRFRYSPRRDAAMRVAAPAPFPGVQIERGDTSPARPEDAIAWSRPDARIVAEALADELNQARLFQRVKVVKKAVPEQRQVRYSHLVRFHIHRFGVRPQDNLAQKAGRTALKYLGPKGYFANKGIPRKWRAEAEIEFTVQDAQSGAIIHSNTYRARPRSVSVSGYAGTDEQARLASEALEEVLDGFVRNLESQLHKMRR